MSDESFRKQDIFDKIMHLPGLRLLEPFYKAHKEILMYLLFGGLAFLINVFLFMGIEKVFRIDALINNIICWIVCVLFQFFTNRIWVFDGHVHTVAAFLKQAFSFFSGRVFTLVVEEIILAVFITWLAFDSMVVKLIAQVVVIVLNYIISKLVVFKR